MDTYELPDAIEPDYWNVVFHGSKTRFNRLVLGRFFHVSAFTYLPGYRGWIVFDAEWGGLRIRMISHPIAIYAAKRFTEDGDVIVKFSRQYRRLALLSRFGFYCVPAIKQLLGLSCVAATPDALYRHLLNNGGEIIGIGIKSAAAATGSDAPTGATASAS